MKLRLVVARFGEMDGAKWWNTNGLLGPKGALLMGRGFPKTHHFAQARVVFAVARARCAELFDLEGSVTLWQLPAEIEDQFDARWQDWLDNREEWAEFFDALHELPSTDLVESLTTFELLTGAQAEAVSKLRRAAEGRAVPLAGEWEPCDEAMSLLAGGFARGEVGKPAIPYARFAR